MKPKKTAVRFQIQHLPWCFRETYGGPFSTNPVMTGLLSGMENNYLPSLPILFQKPADLRSLIPGKILNPLAKLPVKLLFHPRHVLPGLSDP